MPDYLKDTSPLGKSVEEVEQSGQNVTNSPTPGEDRGDGLGVIPAVPMAAAGLGVAGGAAVGGAALLIGDSLGAGDDRDQGGSQSNDTTDSDQA